MDKKKFPHLVEAVRTAPLIKTPRRDGKGTYEFRAYSFGELGSFMTSELCCEITEGLTESIHKYFPDFDLIVGIGSGRGGTWATLASMKFRKPYTEFFSTKYVDLLFLLRYPEFWFAKREDWSTKRVENFYKDLARNFPHRFGLVEVKSAYGVKSLFYLREDYINVNKALVIDDVISEGGTLDTVFNVLKNELYVDPVGAQVILAKSDKYKKLEKKWKIPIKFLIKNTADRIEAHHELSSKYTNSVEVS